MFVALQESVKKFLFSRLYRNLACPESVTLFNTQNKASLNYEVNYCRLVKFTVILLMYVFTLSEEAVDV